MKQNNSQHGGVLAGVLVAFLILAAMAVVGLFMAGMYFADNIHVQKTKSVKGETVQVDTPIGSMRVEGHKRLDPKLIGIPVYPGAARQEDNGGAVSFDFSNDSSHKEFTVLAAHYSTSDSIDKVKEFYHHELPHWMITSRHNGHVKMEYTEDGYKRIIVIHEENGKTHIGLASVGDPAAN